MSRRVTEEQVEKLFQFCRDHYVPFYDLQVELVDHMASSIEEQWGADPELPFDKALKNSFKRFGVYGFSRIKRLKIKEMNRNNRRIMYSVFKNFYRWPKVLMTFMLSMLLFTLFRVIPNDFWVLGGVVALYTIMTLASLHYSKQYKIKVLKGMRFMSVDYLNTARTSVMACMQFPVIFWNVIGRSLGFHFETGILVSAVLSLILVALGFLLYIDLFVLPVKVKEKFLAEYGKFALN
ncbi:MAG: hypothetical protein ACOZDD_10610 [Bacteroidota bacterium]